MINLKIKKLIAVALVAMTVVTVSPIGASAAWKQDSKGWWNTEGGSYSTGWRSINNTWYCFGEDGYMKTGWINDGGKWYFAEPSGAMKTGWINDGGKWYFTDASGTMQTAWIKYGDQWYYTDATGAMVTGVIEIGDKIYCLQPSGEMATGAVVIDGVTYNFAASGEAIGDVKPIPKVIYTATGVQGEVPQTPAKPAEPTKVSSGGGGGGGGGTTKKTFQQIIDSMYNVDGKITIDKDDEDDSLLIVTSPFEAKMTAATIDGKSCIVKKDLYVTLDGSDIGIEGNYEGGFKILKNGTVTASVVITVYDITDGIQYNVTTVPKTLKFDGIS